MIELQSRVGNLEHLVDVVDGLGTCPREGRVYVFKHWLSHQLDEARTLLTLEGLEARIANQGLFGPDDYERAS